MKRRTLAVLIILAVVLAGVANSVEVKQVNAQIPVKREVAVPVKVVFVGIDPATVDTDYIKWNFNLPTTTYGQILLPQPHTTGIEYKVDYSFTYASEEYRSRLVSFLKSIEIVKEGPNPWFYYPVGDPTGYFSIDSYYWLRYSTYDANKVEEWLYSNQQDVGGFPSNAWTLMFLYLPELPSFDFRHYREFLRDHRQFPPAGTGHYYSVGYKDLDLGYRFQYRDFMTGWGGVHRFWFNDFSAGPSFWTGWEDLPLQIALRDNQIDLNTPFGKNWFTEYLADYIWQATWNFITPFFVYTPLYSEKYSFRVHIFDYRSGGEKQEVDIRQTIDSERIRKAFEDLLPYSAIDVRVTFEELSKSPELKQIIDSNYKFTDSFTFGANGAPLRYGVVDMRAAYKYLQENLGSLEPDYRRDRSEFTVPVFAFAFSNETLLTLTYKWIVQRPLETGVKAFLGISLGDIAMISLSQRQFQRGEYATPIQPKKGYGFTEVVIHEAGHMIGLPHPHEFGEVGDFMVSAMGYYTWDYVFGQSDKDALRRSHVDQIYLEVQSLIQELSSSDKADEARAIGDQLRDVDAKYAQMDYIGALYSLLRAEGLAKAVQAGATILPGGIAVHPTVATSVYVLIGVSLGLVGGVVSSWLVFKRGIILGHTQRRIRRGVASRRK